MGRGDFPPWLDSVQSRLLTSSHLLYPVVQVVLAFVHLQLSFSLASPHHESPHNQSHDLESLTSFKVSVSFFPPTINGFLLLLLFVPHNWRENLRTWASQGLVASLWMNHSRLRGPSPTNIQDEQGYQVTWNKLCVACDSAWGLGRTVSHRSDSQGITSHF